MKNIQGVRVILLLFCFRNCLNYKTNGTTFCIKICQCYNRLPNLSAFNMQLDPLLIWKSSIIRS